MATAPVKMQELMETGDAVIARFRDMLREETVTLEADGLIVCTGYTWRKEHPLLEGLAPWFQRSGDGGYKIERNYRVAADPAFAAGVFLQGFSEATHGASETVLSLLPIRAGDIVKSLLTAQAVRNYAL